jgi:nucleoside-diphosphate-sugar epimerase
MSRVIVTGANGLLGTNVIIELLLRGYSVRGLLRNTDSFSYEKHPNLELTQGDFTNTGTADKALRDCDHLIHVAAVARHYYPRYSDYRDVNAVATENLVQLAIKEGLKTFVYISSANVFGYGARGDPGDENREIAKPFSDSHYVQSKLEGQRLALKYKKEIRVIVVNPTMMLGSFDSKPSSGQIILRGLRKVVFYPPGGKNFVHVQDVAKGIVNALETGQNGEAYILSNENLTYKEFFEKVSSLANHHPVYIEIPGFILIPLGILGNCIRTLGLKTNLSLPNVKMLCESNYYSNQKAKTELNLTFQPVDNAIEDALNWFRERGVI